MAPVMMPSAVKTVRKSVGVCRRAGMTRAEALRTVVKVCDAVIDQCTTQSVTLESWIVQVRLVALTSLGQAPEGNTYEWRQ